MKRIALFIAQPYVSVQSTNGIIQSLEKNYAFKLFTKHQLEEGFLDDVDGIMIGGGFGNSDSYDHLFKTNKNLVKKFVRNGGKYIGICMGEIGRAHV